MVRFAEATARMFHRTFVCRRCKTKRKADVRKVLAGRISCRKCSGKAFRTIKSKK